LKLFRRIAALKTNRIDNRRFYHDAILDFGYTVKALRWHSQESQEIRFDQLLALLPPDTASIVDAGCGFADLYPYIKKYGKHHPEYIGLDALESMVEEAKRRTEGAEVFACDVLNDPLPEGEFYLCSGALNTLTPIGALQFIERCFHASSRGIIFNFLEGNKVSKTFNYLPAERIARLGEKLGAKVVFRRNYYEHDCTAAFYKG
jgi:SAM-dependent methyltransferase